MYYLSYAHLSASTGLSALSLNQKCHTLVVSVSVWENSISFAGVGKQHKQVKNGSGLGQIPKFPPKFKHPPVLCRGEFLRV